MRKHFASIMLAAVAMLAALGAYMVNLSVSAERAHVEGLRGSIARDMADIAALQAELRTRARLPQLQQWNDVALRLGAPGPQQLLGAPLQLAAYSPVERRAAAPAAAETKAVAARARALAIAPAPPIARTGTVPAARVVTDRNPGPALVIAAQISDTPLARVAGALDDLSRADLDGLAARARADQSAAATAALGPR